MIRTDRCQLWPVLLTLTKTSCLPVLKVMAVNSVHFHFQQQLPPCSSSHTPTLVHSLFSSRQLCTWWQTCTWRCGCSCRAVTLHVLIFHYVALKPHAGISVVGPRPRPPRRHVHWPGALSLHLSGHGPLCPTPTLKCVLFLSTASCPCPAPSSCLRLLLLSLLQLMHHNQTYASKPVHFSKEWPWSAGILKKKKKNKNSQASVGSFPEQEKNWFSWGSSEFFCSSSVSFNWENRNETETIKQIKRLFFFWEQRNSIIFVPDSK